MLSGLELLNFKAFEKLSLDLLPITVFLGPNNSGKSSILASIRLLTQTIESFDSQIVLLLNGIMGDFGTFGDVVYSGHGVSRQSFQIGIKVKSLVTSSEANLPAKFWDAYISGQELEIIPVYKDLPVQKETSVDSLKIILNGNLLLSTKYSKDTEGQTIESVGEITVPTALRGALSKRLKFQNFLPQYFFMPSTSSDSGPLQEFLTEDMRDTLLEVPKVARLLYRELKSLEYVGAMRMPPSRMYRFTGDRRERVGADGAYTVNLLAMDSLRDSRKSLNILQSVCQWLEKAQVAADVQIKDIASRSYEVRVKHPITQEYQNLADVGQGNSQVLPVLVGGYNLSRGAVYVVEEPEIHLHPSAQAELGSFFLELYEKGVQSLVETHSENLIVRLQQYVAAGKIPPEHIRIYYVYAKGNAKQVIPLELNAQGVFKQDWPEGFFPQRLEEAKKLARIRFRSRIDHGQGK